jgi:hypothetical protein
MKRFELEGEHNFIEWDGDVTLKIECYGNPVTFTSNHAEDIYNDIITWYAERVVMGENCKPVAIRALFVTRLMATHGIKV